MVGCARVYPAPGMPAEAPPSQHRPCGSHAEWLSRHALRLSLNCAAVSRARREARRLDPGLLKLGVNPLHDHCTQRPCDLQMLLRPSWALSAHWLAALWLSNNQSSPSRRLRERAFATGQLQSAYGRRLQAAIAASSASGCQAASLSFKTQNMPPRF